MKNNNLLINIIQLNFCRLAFSKLIGFVLIVVIFAACNDNPDTMADALDNPVRKEGHYKYNYTDGMGNYYGADDPNFNPASLQGNWQKTEPLRSGKLNS